MTDLKKIAKNLLFIDIETISEYSSLNNLPDRMKPLWLKKAGYLQNTEEISEEEQYFNRAGIYAEFGKIIVIGLGFFYWNENDEISFKVKTIEGHDELEVLTSFKKLIENKYKPSDLILCAHNGKEFDFPYLCRRMLIKGVEIPAALQVSGKKPWEIKHLDTLEMWKFGDKKNFTSLELLAAIFNIPSSKNEISGDKVNETYYLENDLGKIARYCREDVIVLAQLFLKFKAIELLKEENIERL